MTLRILMLAPTPFFGDRGCHVRIYEEIRALQRLGHTVWVCTYPVGKDPDGITTWRSWRVPWYRRQELGPSLHKLYLDPMLLLRAVGVVRRFRPHLLHAHLHEGAFLGAFLSRLFRLPLVAGLQGSLTGELEAHGFFRRFPGWAAPFRKLERWIVHQPDLLLASSTAFAATLREAFGVPEQRIVRLLDAVDTERFCPGHPVEDLVARYGLHGKKVVGFLGVLTPYQGVDLLLEAVPRVVSRCPEAHFLIMGYPNVERYRQRAAALGILRHTTFTGRLPYAEAPRHLCLLRVAVSPKLSETEANGKLLNYMAAALPTVVFDTPVSRELLGDDGVYVPPGDAAALADALASLLADPERARRLGLRLRERACRLYGQEALGTLLESCYGRLLETAETVTAT